MTRKRHSLIASPPGRPPQPEGRAAIRNLRKAMGPRPVIYGEYAHEYDLLHGALISELSPEGVIENLLVKDIADAVWMVQRIDRFNAALLKAKLPEASREFLGRGAERINASRPRALGSPLHSDQVADIVELEAHKMLGGDEAGEAMILEFLGMVGGEVHSLTATAFSQNARQMRLLHDMRRDALDHRRKALRDLEQRQLARGRALSIVGDDSAALGKRS